AHRPRTCARARRAGARRTDGRRLVDGRSAGDPALPHRMCDRRGPRHGHRHVGRPVGRGDHRAGRRPGLRVRLRADDPRHPARGTAAAPGAADRARGGHPVDPGHGDRRQRGAARRPGRDGRRPEQPALLGSAGRGARRGLRRHPPGQPRPHGAGPGARRRPLAAL
ncbi:MAG: FIG01129251: hypothetical protein, partial [uncultured Blastococcus sp.]